jgi:DNA-damage-inducible protein J
MDRDDLNVVAAPKTATFQMRINPEIKRRVEAVYAKQGLTLTDAFNVFIQQSLNENGLPFLPSEGNEELMKAKAMRRLLAEAQKGWDSAERDGWVSEEDAYRILGIEP